LNASSGGVSAKAKQPAGERSHRCAHLLTALTGIWLVAAPAVLEYADPARANDWIIGPDRHEHGDHRNLGTHPSAELGEYHPRRLAGDRVMGARTPTRGALE
jgi:hypothetical protein